MFYFIINPSSRSGQGRAVWNQVRALLERKHVSYRAYFTRYTGHGTKIARQVAPRAEGHTLIIIGGDGTINEVINGLPPRARITLGYLPVGSGNDFARGTRLSAEPTQILRGILDGMPVQGLDLGVLSTDRRRSRFAISCGIGYDAEVCYEVSHTRAKKILNLLHLGKLVYAFAAMKLLFTFTPCDMDVELDGKPHHFSDVYFIAAMNLPYEGGGFRFCPEAAPNDGLLDVLVVQDIPKWKILLLFPTAYFAKHTRIRGIHILRGKSLRIRSNRPRRLHRDGEYAGKRARIAVTCEKHAADFYYPCAQD